MSDRDRMLLEKIIAYCQDIASLKNEFGGPEQFRTHLAYRNACAMCVLQIGELSANSEDIPILEMICKRYLESR